MKISQVKFHLFLVLVVTGLTLAVWLSSPTPAKACEPGTACGSCTTQTCSNGGDCATGHTYCVWDANGNYCGGCSEENNNCSSQCSSGVGSYSCGTHNGCPVQCSNQDCTSNCNTQCGTDQNCVMDGCADQTPSCPSNYDGSVSCDTNTGYCESNCWPAGGGGGGGGGTATLRGRVTNATTGAGIPGIVINQGQDCGVGTGTTDASGYYSITSYYSQGFCLRGPSITGYTQTSGNFECQTAGYYQSPDICSRNPGFDMSVDDQYNFSFSPLTNPPKGYLDWVNCTSFGGWACDADSYGTAIDIHFYDGGAYLDRTTANQTREQAVANACGGNANHGFTFSLPNSLKDGRPHNIYAYAINTPGGPNPPLSGVPKSLTCAPPCVANNGQSCTKTSGANSCGQRNTTSGTIQCNGTCSAATPSTPSNPAGYGNSCTSSPNACGQTNTGNIQCNGSCSASTPPNSACPPPPTPTITVRAGLTCVSSSYNGTEATISWGSTTPAVSYIDASDSSTFKDGGGGGRYWHKAVSGLNTNLSGFTYYNGSSVLAFQPGTAYYFRTWNGLSNSAASAAFSIAPCPTPTPTPRPWLKTSGDVHINQ